MKSIILVVLLFILAFWGFLYVDKNFTGPADEPAPGTTSGASKSPLLQSLNESYQQLGGEPGFYLDYSPELVAGSAQKKIILYFNAVWCPTCISADRAFTKNAQRIPGDVIIMKVDYDEATELKEKYNVTYQHTFVQIAPDGTEITRWSGGALDSLLANIK